MGFLGEALGLCRHFRLAGEKLGIVPGEHAAAGAARDDDIIAIGERLDRLWRQRLGGQAVAGIVGGLAAAGLARDDHLAAGVLEELDRGEADRRPDDIDETGDEQADARLGFRHWAAAGRGFVHFCCRNPCRAWRSALVASLQAP